MTDAGFDLNRILLQDDLITGDNCFFAATGLTDGALRMLVMQCTGDLEVRGMASVDPDVTAADFVELTKGAHCAITVDNGDRPYQGIVAIEGESLSSGLEHYFDRSGVGFGGSVCRLWR